VLAATEERLADGVARLRRALGALEH